MQHHYRIPQITSPIGLSDHNSVLWIPLEADKKQNTFHQKIVHPIRESDERNFGQWITECDWNDVQSAPSTSTKTDAFYQTVQSALDQFLPTKNVSVHCNDKPWITYELCFPVTNIFNCSMREGIVPDIWKMSFIIPIPKSNPPTLNNLRPISLTCVFAKIFEDFVGDWILEDIRTLNDKHQFGSLKGSSTTHYLVKLLDDIQKAVDFPKHSAALITTDFSKAFDRIDHHILIEKFIHLGVRTSILPWICSLSSRSQAVRYNGTLSNWETVKAGVPQGTKIGPIAFLVMFNDFVTDHQEVTHYKYVDDMTLSQSFKNSENAIGLQNELDCLQQWADTNNMKINPPKCQALSICFQRTPAVPPSFHIGNSAITNTSCMKILGVHLHLVILNGIPR